MDAVLQDSREENENKALISMLENFKHDSIIIADRNYDSYNNIAHLESKGLKYVIRIKSTTGIVKKFNLPLNEEADFEVNILLTRRLTKEVKENPDKYRYLGTNSTFDFLPQGSKDTYSLKFRIVRIKISDDIMKLLSLIFGTKNFLPKISRRSTSCAGASKLLSVNLNIISVLLHFTQKRRTA